VLSPGDGIALASVAAVVIAAVLGRSAKKAMTNGEYLRKEVWDSEARSIRADFVKQEAWLRDVDTTAKSNRETLIQMSAKMDQFAVLENKIDAMFRKLDTIRGSHTP